MGAGYDHPTPVELRNRLKWYILGKHSGHVLSSANIEEDCDSSMFVDIEKVRSTDETVSDYLWKDEDIFEEEMLINFPTIKERCINEMKEIEEHSIREESGKVLNLSTYEPTPQESKLIDEFEQVIVTEKIEKNALIYIAGYVAHRFRHQFTELGIPTKDLPNPPSNDWLCMFSRGNCIYPSESFKEDDVHPSENEKILAPTKTDATQYTSAPIQQRHTTSATLDLAWEAERRGVR
ncbi:PREDICTED: uncharacterized protein LOC108780083 [Cyphomyrmex costatus]|uniref:uncharacterized protein LOC108780083 n=1 Tax=Cyphomyrmex costatus TaxID=456900 RepID=UPI0008524206|nr:PREDICTED: uncharacterized protein LOC108780083 [Cyphomyrmex costatus]